MKALDPNRPIREADMCRTIAIYNLPMRVLWLVLCLEEVTPDQTQGRKLVRSEAKCRSPELGPLPLSEYAVFFDVSSGQTDPAIGHRYEASI